MLFTSLEFFAFLPLALLAFAALPAGKRWIWLLVASWVFYGYARPANLVYLGAVTIVVLACGRALAQATGEAARRAALAVGLVAVLGSLVAFKYYDFIAAELGLPKLGLATPVGYSFYAFSAAACLIDLFARRIAGESSAGRIALYLAWFPKILAGPI